MGHANCKHPEKHPEKHGKPAAPKPAPEIKKPSLAKRIVAAVKGSA